MRPISGEIEDNSLSPGDSDTSSFGLSPGDIVDLPCLQAQIFLEDAENYRSIHHKIDQLSLKLIRIYYSLPVRILLHLTIFLLLLFPFIESPSSLSWSADIRKKKRNKRFAFPCAALEIFEFCFLLILSGDAGFKSYIYGMRNIKRNPWLIAYYICLALSFADWAFSMGFLCTEMIRIRRYLRPFFLIQNSPMMKKIIKSLKNSIPEMISALVLLFVWLVMATIFGMYLFSSDAEKTSNVTDPGGDFLDSFREGNHSRPTREPPVTKEADDYFSNFFESLFNLLVLLTTANNPDIMMTVYNKNRFYAIYFITFLLIGLYVLMNILTVIVYNQFRGYFLTSMQTSYFRRRVAIRAAFEVLQSRSVKLSPERCNENEGVEVSLLRKVLSKTHITPWKKVLIDHSLINRMGAVIDAQQFKEVFNTLELPHPNRKPVPLPRKTHWCLHGVQKVIVSQKFILIGALVSVLNVISLAVEVVIVKTPADVDIETHHGFKYGNAAFIFYYFIEQLSKFWAFGSKGYFSKIGNAFECILTVILVTMEFTDLVILDNNLLVNRENVSSFIDFARMINLLIIVRAMRIIIKLPSMRLITVTLFDLARNMSPVIGLFMLIYYLYALLGMALLGNTITVETLSNITKGSSKHHRYECGSYAQLEYWSNNFDDFAASLVVLWDLMVVNNWHVIVLAYKKVNSWIVIYMVSWWLISVVIVLNVALAIIIENFIFRWDRYKTALADAGSTRRRSVNIERSLSFHQMFHDNLQEPDDTSLLRELSQHEYLCDDLPHLHLSFIST